MTTLRTIRRKMTASATNGAWRLAPWVPSFAIDAMQAVLGRAGPITPVLARTVAKNMRKAGVYDRAVSNEYFRLVARHLANGLRIRRWQEDPEAVAALARKEIDLDPSIDRIREAAASGRGAVIAPAHCCNFLVSLARLGQEVPICIYLRWSGDRRKLEMKRAWCRAAGLDVIIEEPNRTDPTSRAAVCVDALRDGRILVITPDIAQKSREGTPVRWLDRRAYLPTGPASLAMLAEVRLIPLFARYRAHVHVAYCEEPIAVASLSREQGGRKEAVRRAMQSWADGFSSFIRECPQAWFLWGDSRWTLVLNGDARYAGTPAEAAV